MSSDTKEEDCELLDAGEVYLLMKKEYRISRNIRASWFFAHLNNAIHIKSEDDLRNSKEELEVLSVIPRNVRKVTSAKPCKYRLIPTSHVTFLARCYRLVFILDLSPSMLCVDILSGQVSYDAVFSHFRNCLLGLIKPFTVPGSSLIQTPQIYVTVVAYTPLLSSHARQVLVQGCLITKDNVDSLLKRVQADLDQFENCLFEASMESIGINPHLTEADQLTGGLFDDIIDKRPRSPAKTTAMATPETGLVDMLRYGILALQLLPENTSAGIIVITDGITGLPDMAITDNLLSELRKSTVACSFIQVGRGYHPHCSFGAVPHLELMQAVATATFGAFLAKCPNLDQDNSGEMNVYHKAFFSWNFQKGLDGVKIDYIKGRQHEVISADIGWTSDSIKPSFVLDEHGMCRIPMIRKKHAEDNFQTSIFNILSLRLREGYTIKDVALTKSDSQLEVRLALPWRHNVRVEYLALSPWPVSAAKRTTHVEVTIEGSYEFLHDVTCTTKQLHKSMYRTIVVKRFWQTLQSLQQTDQMLVHLMSFAANPAYYNIPDSIKKGVPLFYLPPNSGTPVLVEYGSAKETGLSQFATYWKPIILMDINIWQKWLHTHRIGLILVHDLPLPKHLHLPNVSGRYHSIMCRKALSELNSLLREWSTFVLMENHSYVKLLFSDKDGPPTSFYILRVTSKPPCMVLRLAFLGGTPGHERNEIVNALKEKLLRLTLPQTATQQEKEIAVSKATPKRNVTIVTPSNRPTLQRSISEKKCIVTLHKPVEKILIRYDRLPVDFSTVYAQQPVSLSSSQIATTAKMPNRTASTMFNTLSKYMYHQRWVWSTYTGNSIKISTQSIAKILSTITKVRLAEGFNFANCNSGIISFLVELEMKVPCQSKIAGKANDTDTEDNQLTESDASCDDNIGSGGGGGYDDDEVYVCVMQYILFPPHTTTLRDSFTADEVDPEFDTPEADGELQMVTECWIEPQSGIVFNSPEERNYLENLSFKQVAQAVFPIDQEVMTTLLTFEHLRLMCHNVAVSSPVVSSPSTPSFKQSNQEVLECKETTIHKVPFDFSVTKLLPKCQQVELLFSTFSEAEQVPPEGDTGTDKSETYQESANEILFQLLHEQLEDMNNREVTLSDHECSEFPRLVLQRDRQGVKPVFEIPDKSDEKTSKKPRQDTLKDTSLNSSRNQPFLLPGSERTGDWSDSQQTTSSAKDTSQRLEDVRKQLKDDSSVPRWSCFVKTVEHSHNKMQFTIMPASYEDLKKLMKKKDQEQLPKRHEEGEKVDAGLQAKENVESKKDSGKKVELKDDDEPDGLREMERESKVGRSPREPRWRRQSGTTDKSTDADAKPSFRRSWSVEANRRISQGTDNSSCTTSGLSLPIYVYDCSYSSLTDQLIKKDTNRRNVHDDVFQDLRFVPFETAEDSDDDGDDDDGRYEYDGKEPGRPRKERRQSGGSGKHYSDRRPSSNLVTQNQALAVLCNTLSDGFYRCFVTGLYKSLCVSRHVDCLDVELAVDKVCEEALLEIDITDYLQAVCGHVTDFSEKVNIQEHAMESLQRTTRLAGKIEEDSTDSKSVATSNEEEIPFTPDLAMIGQSSTKPMCTFPLSSLKTSKICEASEGLHDFIRKKFNEIWGQYFKPVPSNPDFYFYDPPNKENSLSDDEGELEDGVFSDTVLDSSTSDFTKDVITMTDRTLRSSVDKDLVPSIPKVHSVPSDSHIEFIHEESKPDQMTPRSADERGSDYTRSGDDRGSDFTSDSEYLDIYTDDVDNEIDSELGSSMESVAGSMIGGMPPLFVCLTCSVRKGKSKSVVSLPTCLGGIIDCFDDPDVDIDLSDLNITLDIICLTLPPDLDMSMSSLRPVKRERTTSTGSMSSPVGSPPDTDFMGLSVHSELSLPDSAGNFPTELTVDPLSTLPDIQKEVITQAEEQIKWLLKDEIASAKRLMTPINASTLEMVAAHVQASTDKPTCKAEHVPLQFVFGAEQSLGKFTEEFEEMDITGYCLQKEDTYYYLTRDKEYMTTLARAKALENAVAALSRESLLNRDDMLDQSLSSNDPKSPRVKSFEQGIENVPVKEKEKESPGTPVRRGSRDIKREAEKEKESKGTEVESVAKQLDDGGRESEGQKDAGDEEKKVDEKTLDDDAKGTDDNSSGSSIQILSEEHGGESRQMPSVDQPGKEISDVVVVTDTEADVTEQHDEQEDGKTEAVSMMSKDGSFIILERTSGTESSSNHDNDENTDKTASTEIAEDVVAVLETENQPVEGNGEAGGDQEQKQQQSEDDNKEKSETVTDTSQIQIEIENGSTSEAMSIPPSAIPERLYTDGTHRSSPSSEGTAPFSPSMTSTVSSSGVGTPLTEVNESDNLPSSDERKHRRQASILSTMSSGFTSVNASRISLEDEEEGYEGGTSDSDDEGHMMSETDIGRYQSLMPEFWLILKINEDKVDVFFHSRDYGDTDSLDTQGALYGRVKDAIRQTCRTVNQMMLLQDLHDTRLCNALLVAESDEDVWKQDEFTTSSTGLPRVKSDLEEFSDAYQQKGDYLAATMKFDPGYFACDCVWTTHIAVHPRLRTGPGRMGASRGIQALRTVIDALAVSNRKNMFVYKEREKGSVFYLRLYESMCVTTEGVSVYSEPPTPRLDEPSSTLVSRASSIMSLPVDKTAAEEDQLSIASGGSRRPSDRDSGVDTMSMMSKVSGSSKHQVGESVQIDVHGITQAGPEICQELIQVLRNRLSEHTLDIITMLLARNPLCKLTPTDVQFIQPPGADPASIIHFTIPQFWSAQLFAIGYYLRQNMLQFLHHPKYVDNKAEHHFQHYSTHIHAYTDKEIPEKDVFLYNRPQSSGRKGIAAIALSMVDGKGNPVSIISSPRPVVVLESDLLAMEEFDSLTHAATYTTEVDQDSKYPGPTSLIQFCIWESGNVDIPQLTDKLMLAVRHSLCDVIMEYRVLTAPLGFWPYTDVSSVGTSLATSPVPTPPIVTPPKGASESKSAGQSPSLIKQMTLPAPDSKSADHSLSTSPVNISSNKRMSMADVFMPSQERGFFRQQRSSSIAAPDHASMQSMLDSHKSRRQLLFDGGVSQESPKVPAAISMAMFGRSPKGRGADEVERQQRLQKRQKKREELEAGERGILHPVYQDTCQDWMEFENKLGVPAVHKLKGTLFSRFSVDICIQELLSLINSICPDIVNKVFKEMDDGSYQPVNLSQQLSPEEKADSSQSEPSKPLTTLPIRPPGLKVNYMIVGRNITQWRATIDMDNGEDTANYPNLMNPKTRKSFQHYDPLDPGVTAADKVADYMASFSVGMDTPPVQLVVPRQRLVMIAIQDKQLTGYTYNWSSELTNMLDKLSCRLFMWHNARTHLLQAIVNQKIGLFHHRNFGDLEDNRGKEMNPFCRSTDDIDMLIKRTAPPMREHTSRGFSSTLRAPSHHVHPGVPVFDEIFRDSVPPQPVQKCSYNTHSDPVIRHGTQLVEIHARHKKEAEIRMKLENLYVMWQQRGTHSNMPISEDTMTLLKMSSRLVHYCATPLLFSPWWRKHTLISDQDSPGKVMTRGTISPKPDRNNEEPWHNELRLSFAQQYIQYLQQLGFSKVNTRPPSPKRSPRMIRQTRATVVRGSHSHSHSHSHSQSHTHSETKKPSGHTRLELLTQSSGKTMGPTYFLQKAVPGGIMLMELSFQHCYFLVKLYALEASRLPAGRAVNPQASFYSEQPSQIPHLSVLFTHECDKFKDLIHVNSFTFDFHLRCIQSYLAGRQIIFQQGYHVTSFLSDFIKFYTPGPNFSRSHIYEGTMSFRSEHTPADLLFEYMLQHAHNYSMKAMRMVNKASPDADNSEVRDHEYIMVTQTPRAGTFEDTDGFKHFDDFEVGIIISHDRDNRPPEKHPKSERELLSRVTGLKGERSEAINRKLLLKLKYYVILTSRKDLFPKLTLTKRLGKLRSTDIPPRETTHGHLLMMSQARTSADKINIIVKQVEMHCRRDTLWQRMYFRDISGDDDSKESKKKKKKDMEGENDDKPTKLNFSEFNELLRMVHSTPLTNIDSQLATLLTLPSIWYEKLMKVLQTRFPESSRCFTSQDGEVKYLAILNPHYLDMMMLLSVDGHSKKTDFCAVYREPMKEVDRPDKNVMAIHDHVQNVVNAACYHMWATIL
ncbi:KICSTOR complex protein SZT2-like isoform X2 [Glandiceps talaboti]